MNELIYDLARITEYVSAQRMSRFIVDNVHRQILSYVNHDP